MTPSCSAIDTGLFIAPNGTVKTCCSGAYELGSVYHEPLDDIFTSQKYIKIKSDLDHHVPSDYCSGCDAQGLITPGQTERDKFNHDYPSTGQRQLKQIDLRWSNVCNLSCRYCNSYSSSEWSKLLGEPLASTNRDYIQSVLTTITENRDTIQSVYLLGGEPLLQKHNQTALNLLNHNTHIVIFTNLSVRLDNNQIYHLLKRFPNVNWNISFDNVLDKFEYVRSGAKWSTFVDNLNRLISDFGAEKINFHPVYSIWSCTDLIEFYDFYDKYPGVCWPTWQLVLNEYNPRLDGNDAFKVFGHNQAVTELALKESQMVYGQLPDIESKDFFNSVQYSLETYTINPEFSQRFLSWTKKMESLIPAQNTFSDLWPELHLALTINNSNTP